MQQELIGSGIGKRNSGSKEWIGGGFGICLDN